MQNSQNPRRISSKTEAGNVWNVWKFIALAAMSGAVAFAHDVAAETNASLGAGGQSFRQISANNIDAKSPQATTQAIQDAIDACSKAGGGRIEILPGLYPVTPIQLKSNVDLHLAAGATLRFSRDFADYPLMWIDDGSGREAGCRSPINGEGITNASITGGGIIDGQGDAWRAVKKSKLSAEAWDSLVQSGGVTNEKQNEWYPATVVRDGREGLVRLADASPAAPLEAYEPYKQLLRPNLVRLVNCTNLKLQGVTFRNSASWNVHLSLCNRVEVRGVTIFNVAWAQNGDGIDLDSCRDVLVTDSTVNAGDDAICLKSGKDEAGRRRGRPTENITITRCTVGTGHGGIVIGSEMSGGVRHVNVSDCTFNGTDNGLRFKSARGRGGVVDDVTVTNVKMSDIRGVAVLFDLYYSVKSDARSDNVPPVTDATPVFRNFRISNVDCTGAGQAVRIRGLPEMPLENILLKNVNLRARSAGFVTEAKDVHCEDVRVQADDGSLVKVANAPGFQGTDIRGFDRPADHD